VHELPDRTRRLTTRTAEIVIANAERHIGTGNPYKELIAGLMSRACTLSCAARPREFTTWGNEDLLPGIRVNTDAGARMIQLVQQGFVKFTE
jgi:hypothetical protein